MRHRCLRKTGVFLSCANVAHGSPRRKAALVEVIRAGSRRIIAIGARIRPASRETRTSASGPGDVTCNSSCAIRRNLPAIRRPHQGGVDRVCRWKPLLATSIAAVWGFDGAGAELFCRQLLDHRAMLHDEQPFAEMRDHRQVMADEDVGEPVLGAQRFEQVQDLRLHRCVERRGRLVEQDDRGRRISARAMATRWRCPPESWCG